MRYLIIGNGVAGTTAADQIRKQDRTGAITMVSAGNLPFYYRIRLNDFLAGELDEQALIARKADWYRERNIDLRLSTRIIGVDPLARTAATAGGDNIPYDRLLLATGSHPFVPAIKGADRPGVFTLHTIADARKIAAAAKTGSRAVLIGGGLLGLETGNALRRLGKQVTVVEFSPRLLPRQLDAAGAGRLRELLTAMGFVFRLNARTEEITGTGQGEGVRLTDGELLAADMVLLAAGVRPDLELAAILELDRDKGIKVDERLRTSQPDIYAAGDTIEFRGAPYGIWPAAQEQGRIAGANMAGDELVYNGTTPANILKVAGIDLATAGEIDADGRLESMVDATATSYKKIVIRDNRLAGCILLGDTKAFPALTRAIADQRDIGAIKDKLLTDPTLL